jgi:dUTPase
LATRDSSYRGRIYTLLFNVRSKRFKIPTPVVLSMQFVMKVDQNWKPWVNKCTVSRNERYFGPRPQVYAKYSTRVVAVLEN